MPESSAPDRAGAPDRQAGIAQGITLLLPSGLSIMAIVVLVPVLPLLLDHFRDVPGAAYRVPMLLTVPAACLVVASPLAGWLADRFGRRRLLLAAMVIYAAVGMAPMLLDGYWPIFTSRVALGWVEAVVLTTSTTLIGDFFAGPARDRWLGYQIGVASIFATVLIWVGGALATYGWRGPFAVYASAWVMAALVARNTWEPQAPAARSAAPDWAGFPWRTIAGLCALTLFGSVLFYFVLIELPVLFAQNGLAPSATSGFWLAVVGLGISLGTVVFGFIVRIGTRSVLALAFAILALGFWGMSLAHGIAPLIVMALINQFGAGLLMPALLTWATRSLPFHHRGRGTGMWQGSFSLGQFVMPILVTAISTGAPDMRGAMRLLAMLAAIAALVAAAALLAVGSGSVLGRQPARE